MTNNMLATIIAIRASANVLASLRPSPSRPSLVQPRPNLFTPHGHGWSAALDTALIARLPQQAREVLDPARGELAELPRPSPDETGLSLDFDEPQKPETAH